MRVMVMRIGWHCRLLVPYTLIGYFELAAYTEWGYVSSVNDASKKSLVTRLRRIEGQVGGLIRMVEEDRYCVDVLTQINAVRAALHKVEKQILEDHVSHCVAHAFSHGDKGEQRLKIEELVETIGRMTR